MQREPAPLATVLGLGRLRPAPGTWGSLPPIVVAAILLYSGFGPQDAPWVYHAVLGTIILVFSWGCISQGDRAEAFAGRKDPGDVVADEVVGQSIVLLFLPAAGTSTPLLAAWTLVLAFLFFRVLDILKPWPAGAVQRVPGGWGILLDDVIAGGMAWVLLQVVARVSG